MIAGVSFGGLIAVHYAGRRPEAVSRLVLASAPSPRWALSRRETACIRRPVLTLPLFVARGANRLLPEVMTALPTWATRTAFARYYAAVALRRPGSPRKMAAWVRQWMDTDIAAECHHVRAPTLVLTGEPHLDRVVPVSSSLDYLRLIPGARHIVMPGTGHLGAVVQPTAFAEVLRAFATERHGRVVDAPVYVEAAPRIH
jgi:pimeloyl-ACP methyl ester carboxylesterase